MSETYQHSPLLEAVMENTERYSTKTAIMMNGCEVSYGQLGANIRKAATVLNNLGAKAGDRIILSAHKDVEYIYLYFGAHILGVTNVIVDAESNEERLCYIESKVKPICCFGYQSSQFPSKKFEELDLDKVEEYVGSDDTLSESDIAEILFTTGTTGAPKGVCLSYYNIFSSASNINDPDSSEQCNKGVRL